MYQYVLEGTPKCPSIYPYIYSSKATSLRRRLRPRRADSMFLLLALLSTTQAFVPRNKMAMTPRNNAHPWTVLYAPQYPNAQGAVMGNWFAPGGPTSLINNWNGQCPAACSGFYISSDRIEDSRFGNLPHELRSRLHPHTGEIIFDPRGLGGKHNLPNPWHAQIPDGFGPGGPGTGDLVLDIGHFYNLGDTLNRNSANFNPLLQKMGGTLETNLSEDGAKVQRDLALGGFYNRYPTAATAPAGWPAQFLQPAGGRVAGAGTAPSFPRHRQRSTPSTKCHVSRRLARRHLPHGPRRWHLRAPRLRHAVEFPRPSFLS